MADQNGGNGAAESDNQVVDIKALNAPDWLKAGLQKLDLDGDGLEREEVEDMMVNLAHEGGRAEQQLGPGLLQLS